MTVGVEVGVTVGVGVGVTVGVTVGVEVGVSTAPCKWLLRVCWSLVSCLLLLQAVLDWSLGERRKRVTDTAVLADIVADWRVWHK